MRRAILIVGFNNWGKTTRIVNLFRRNHFRYRTAYRINGIDTDFTVETRSNDDLNQKKYMQTIWNRLNKNRFDFFGALCPTRREIHRGKQINDSRKILKQLCKKFDEVYLFYLRFKWDNHAELRIKEIKHYLRNINNLYHVVISRKSQVIGRLKSIY
jgi:hypothetical protein